MKKSKGKVKVYIEYINYLGEVNDSYLIAEFISKNWAEIFINNLPTKETDMVRYRIEED